MKTVRSGVFETNSSSSHSIHIGSGWAKNSWRFVGAHWPNKTIDGTKYHSLVKLKENKIVLYKTDSIYSHGEGSTIHLGEEILDQKEIGFTVSKIKKAKNEKA